MIYISAGHHSLKKGASFEEFYEHDEALVWVDLLVCHLKDIAVRVPPGVLKEKVKFINEGKAKIAIEVHFNSAIDSNGNRVGKGSETLYYPGSEKGLSLAKAVQLVLARHFPPSRGVKEGWYRMDKRKGPDYFLARTKCPAIIIEPEFVHRKEIIRSKRSNACEDLAHALREYYERGLE